jgi:hypothetical protein
MPRRNNGRRQGIGRRRPRYQCGLSVAGHLRIGVYRFTMNLGSGLIDDDDRERAIVDAGIVTKPPCELSAVLDGAARRRKLQCRSAPGWNTVPGVEVVSPHRVSCSRRLEESRADPAPLRRLRVPSSQRLVRTGVRLIKNSAEDSTAGPSADSLTIHLSATPLKSCHAALRAVSWACCESCSLAYFQPRRVRPGLSPGVPFEGSKWLS